MVEMHSQAHEITNNSLKTTYYKLGINLPHKYEQKYRHPNAETPMIVWGVGVVVISDTYTCAQNNQRRDDDNGRSLQYAVAG